MITLLAAEPADVSAMAGRFRRADVEELLFSHATTPEQAILHGLRLSQSCVTAWYDGRPIAMAGLYRPWALGTTGMPWMVGTDGILLPRVRSRFLKASRLVLAEYLKITPRLENWVYDGNTAAVRWLRWLGFEIHEPEPYGVAGKRFHHFTMGV